MIGWLKGKVLHRGKGFIIIDTGNVGYKVFVPPQIKNSNPELYIHHHIREDANTLYGFETPAELSFFELLIGVPGVGPKMAMAIITASPIDTIRDSILRSDLTTLTAIPGVGNKLAGKIVVELKSKLARGAEVDVSNFDEQSNDLVEALSALGYARREIAPLLAKLPRDLASTQAKLTWALKHLTVNS